MSDQYTDPLCSEAPLRVEAALPREPSARQGGSVAPASPGRPTKNAQYEPGSERLNGDYHNMDRLSGIYDSVYKEEKPWHRTVANMRLTGMSIREIAVRCGFTSVTISRVLRLPWVLDYMKQSSRNSGVDEVHELLKLQAVDSINTLIEVRDDPEALNRDRITAAINFIDRVYGKPNQPLTHYDGDKPHPGMSDEELERIAAKGSGAL